MLEITPPKPILPPLPKVNVRFTLPKDILLEKVKFEVELAKLITVLISPNCIFPPITIFEYLPLKFLLALPATVPPFKVKSPGVVFPPIALVPPAINAPAFKVNPPP